MDRFPVLMYHRIVSDRCPVPGGDGEEARYAVDLEEFDWQLGRISGSGRRGVSVGTVHDELAARRRVPSEWVALTFDDGNLSDYVHARPLLAERGFSATFFVSCDRLGVDGGLDGEMLRQMTDEGLEIGSHGVSHRFLSGLDETEELDELKRSKELLERACGKTVRFFAPPGGRIGRRGMTTARSLRYEAVCTSEFGFNGRSRQRFEIRRIPVTAATSRACFSNIIEAAAFRLLPLYVRDSGLRLARKMLGEALYGRVRAAGLGS